MMARTVRESSMTSARMFVLPMTLAATLAGVST